MSDHRVHTPWIEEAATFRWDDPGEWVGPLPPSCPPGMDGDGPMWVRCYPKSTAMSASIVDLMQREVERQDAKVPWLTRRELDLIEDRVNGR